MTQEITINPENYLSVGSYAKQYRKTNGEVGVSNVYIYQLIREGKIPSDDIIEIDGFKFIKKPS